jgi:hypothetical protein
MFSPPQNTPVTEKGTTDYGLKIARFIENAYVQGIAGGNISRSKMVQRLRYAQGRQDQILRGNRENDRNTPDQNRDYAQNGFGANPESNQYIDNVKIANKIISAVVGKLMQVKVKPKVAMIDARSMNERLQYEAKLRLLMTAQQMGADVDGFLAQFQMTREQIPIDSDDLQVMLDAAPQLEVEQNLELAVQDVWQKSGEQALRYEFNSLMVNQGIAGFCLEKVSNERVIHVLDPMFSGCDYFASMDGREVNYNYRIEMLPVDNVKYQAQNSLTSDEIEKIHGGYIPNVPFYGLFGDRASTRAYFQDDYCFVLSFQIRSHDTLYLGIDNDGKPIQTFEKPQPGTYIELYQSIVINIYEGKYVLGQGVLYNYGQKTNTTREPIDVLPEDYGKVNPANAYSDYVWVQLPNARGGVVSLTDRLMPHINTFQITWNKMSKAIANFVPQVITIDYDAVSEVVVGGEKITGEAVLKNFFHTGIQLYTSSVYKGQPNLGAKQAVTVQDNAGGGNIQFLANQLAQQLSIMQDMCGVPPAVQGSAPEKYVSATATAQSITSTDNVLFEYYFCQNLAIENMSKVLMYDICMYGGEGFLGNRPYHIDTQVYSQLIPTLKIETMPDDIELQTLMQNMSIAQEKGFITPGDYIFLQRVSRNNLLQAQLYFISKEKRGKMAAEQQAAQNQQYNIDSQRASAVESTKQKMAIERIKGSEQRKNEILKYVLENPDANVSLPKIKEILSFIESDSSELIQKDIILISDGDQQQQ